MKIVTKSPTRVDLAGGTLDCWPLYTLVGGCETTNLAINIFTHVELEPRSDKVVELSISDLKYERQFANVQEAISCADPQLDLVRAHLQFWLPKNGFTLHTRSESPVGGGLGGSSSLCISLIKAFSKWQERKFTTYEMVNLAHNLEAQVLKKPTGTQDYFPAAESGLNVIHYSVEGAKIEALNFSPSYFKERMFLVYTGQPHHSGLNNWQVIKASIDGDKSTVDALQDIRRIAGQVSEACRQGKWEALPSLFQEESKARVRLSPGFSSSRIEELQSIVIGAGGLAVKICGAGGGGCVMVWSSPDQKGAVAEACQKNGYQVLLVDPVEAET